MPELTETERAVLRMALAAANAVAPFASLWRANTTAALALVRRGFLVRRRTGYALTQAGRDALAGVDDCGQWACPGCALRCSHDVCSRCGAPRPA
jgi:hypothetical protein